MLLVLFWKCAVCILFISFVCNMSHGVKRLQNADVVTKYFLLTYCENF